MGTGDHRTDDGQSGALPRTWTVRLRWPIAVGTAVLALLCFGGLFSDAPDLRWVGAVGLVLLGAWAVTFRVLVRRGY